MSINTSTHTFADLLPGARNAIRVCLNVQPYNKVLIVADRRNQRIGNALEQAVQEVGMVVEGMNALPAAIELSARYRVDMPIVQTVNAIVNQGMDPADAVHALMTRDPKGEI